MVLGLLTASLASVICYLITSYIGFTAGAAGITRHFLFGFFTTFLVTLSQSMTMFYFIGTGKHVRELVANDAKGPEFVQKTKDFKNLFFPPAVWAMVFTMAAMIIGAGVHTKAVPWWVHLGLSILGIYFNLVAFWRGARYMIEQNLLMQEIETRMDATPEAH